ncbi:uncharacterized protein BXZ73DRAFT_73525 [Epithele typhae]|uniref:uncharacterized protein n=1 Tax=Epithele typhae TaxID=378194 RepID=UPI0020087230|nr:uncharacterized protein BXZ73DRAFT_73525 [Epithele typhae]KAH9945370.1 hypothetical protein BXZ73DRAFT_73525 [Epithele typhae]
MSSVLRTLSKHTRTLSAAARAPVASTSSVAAPARAFHSPFAVLASSGSPLTVAPKSPPPAGYAGIYEKNIEYPAEPIPSGFGTRTYVVSQPDPANTPYSVPAGAYPTSAPYVAYPRADAPPAEPGAQFASASTGFAHPLSQRVLSGELPDVNPSPLHENAEKFSKLGVDNAWKARK